MANTKSALKRARIAVIRAKRNHGVKSTVRSAVRKLQEILGAGDAASAEAKLREATRTIDKAVSKGVVHKNTAARKKSRLAKKLAALRQAQ